MTTEELRKVQLAQYELLKIIDDICKKNSIIYYMAYGTLLGAVRHQGSIPWDNDIDIWMTFDNYLKFLKVKNQMPKDYYIYNFGKPDDDNCSVVRVIKKANNGFTISKDNINYALGVTIDIFILYPAKKMNVLRRKITKPLISYLNVAKLNEIERKILLDHFKHNKLKQLLVHTSTPIGKLLGERRIESFILKWLIDKTGQSSDEYVVATSGRTYKKEWFNNTIELRYEESMFMAPSGWDVILKHIYNNYMELPPENERFVSSMNNYSLNI